MNLLILTQKVDEVDDNLGFFVVWIKKFGEKCENVRVITNFYGSATLPSNVQVFSLGKEKKIGRMRRYIRFYKYILQTLPESDAIFVHMIPAWVLLIWPIALIYRKKIYLWYAHKSVTLSLRVADKLATKTFSSSKEGYRLNSKKLVITGQGIDVAHFETRDFSADPKWFKLLSVGRISQSKNYNFLIEVVSELNKIEISKEFILDIVGDTITSADVIYKKHLENKIGTAGLVESVKFLGVKTYAKMPNVYNHHDILIHASDTGSLDKVVLEAMSCALPVATTSEAFYKILPERYLIKQKDSRAMAERIIQLKGLGRDLSLREIVTQNHNLNNLVEKIITNL